jgi:hypothetical protein
MPSASSSMQLVSAVPCRARAVLTCAASQSLGRCLHLWRRACFPAGRRHPPLPQPAAKPAAKPAAVGGSSCRQVHTRSLAALPTVPAECRQSMVRALSCSVRADAACATYCLTDDSLVRLTYSPARDNNPCWPPQPKCAFSLIATQQGQLRLYRQHDHSHRRGSFGTDA